MDYTVRRVLLVILDIIAINLSIVIALFIHFEGAFPGDVMGEFVRIFLFVSVGKLMIFGYFQLYNSVWAYASIEELLKVVMAVTFSQLFTFVFLSVIRFPVFPGVFLVAYAFEILSVGGIRFSYRVLRRLRLHQSIVHSEYMKIVLIVGSGSTASLIATEIKNHPDVHGKVIGFIDDDFHKVNKTIGGTKVIGTRYDIYSIVKRQMVDEIIIALPSADSEELKEVLAECKRSNAKVRIMPGVREIIGGRVTLSQVRDVDLEDILGNVPVDMHIPPIASYIEDKTILVTGAGGTIGLELCKQIGRLEPKKLVLLDINENAISDATIELNRLYPNMILEVLTISVEDRSGVKQIMALYQPDVVFHTAAQKNIPLLEMNPKSAVKINTIGTQNLVDASKESGVKLFMLISTDKAQTPVSVMGATKRLAELLVLNANDESDSEKYAVIRFGNILDSHGSVVPLFKKQISQGGPLTVTHPEMNRTFITATNAAKLALCAGAIKGKDGLYVVEMGQVVNIKELAEDLIRLSGLKPYKDIDIEFIGLRNGEQLTSRKDYFIGDQKETAFKGLYVCECASEEKPVTDKQIQQLSKLIRNGSDQDVIMLLKKILPTYSHSSGVGDRKREKVENIEKYR